MYLDKHWVDGCCVNVLLEVHLHELKHKVQLHVLVNYALQPVQEEILVRKKAGICNGRFLKSRHTAGVLKVLLYNVGMLQLFKEGYFTNGGARNTFVLGLEAYLFHGDKLARLFGSSLVNDAIGTLSYLLYLFIVTHRHIDNSKRCSSALLCSHRLPPLFKSCFYACA